jgi:hypothetical protein
MVIFVIFVYERLQTVTFELSRAETRGLRSAMLVPVID